MSEETKTDKTEEIKKRVYHPSPVVKWTTVSADEKADYGEVIDGEIEIDATIPGRLDIWAVPKCEACPDGLWVKMFNGEFFEASEPGVEDWNKHLLAKIRFSGHDKLCEYGTDPGSGKGVNGLEYVDPIFEQHLDAALLNPTDINVISIDDDRRDVKANTYVDLNAVFTGEVVGTWTVNITPNNGTLKGFASDTDFVLAASETKTITGTKEEINAELEHVQFHTGDSSGSVDIKWDYDQKVLIIFTVPVKTEPTPEETVQATPIPVENV